MVNPDLIISMVILLVFILFLGYILYLLYSSGFSTTPLTNSIITNPTSQRGPAMLQCPPGQCATSLVTGTKRCPLEDSTPIDYNPALEVCNSRFLCDNRATPFASQTDGSSVISGECQDGVECACYSNLYCPNYISSIFTTSNGNIAASLSQQRISFPQINAYDVLGAKVAFTNSSSNLCTVPVSWLPLSNPGCGFVSGGYTNNMNFDELQICMGQTRNCNGVLNSPCLSGVLSVITSDPESLTKENIPSSQVGCVFGEPCQCGEISIYDTNFGGIVCKTFP